MQRSLFLLLNWALNPTTERLQQLGLFARSIHKGKGLVEPVELSSFFQF